MGIKLFQINALPVLLFLWSRISANANEWKDTHSMEYQGDPKPWNNEDGPIGGWDDDRNGDWNVDMKSINVNNWDDAIPSEGDRNNDMRRNSDDWSDEMTGNGGDYNMMKGENDRRYMNGNDWKMKREQVDNWKSMKGSAWNNNMGRRSEGNYQKGSNDRNWNNEKGNQKGNQNGNQNGNQKGNQNGSQKGGNGNRSDVPMEKRRLEDSIPGVPGKSYPDYEIVPKTNFDCNQHANPGYYGDVEARCQVFHICQKGGRQDAFLCPVGTLFNQKTFVCDWWYNVNCGETTNHYQINANLYKPSNGFHMDDRGIATQSPLAKPPSLDEPRVGTPAIDPRRGNKGQDQGPCCRDMKGNRDPRPRVPPVNIPQNRWNMNDGRVGVQSHGGNTQPRNRGTIPQGQGDTDRGRGRGTVMRKQQGAYDNGFQKTTHNAWNRGFNFDSRNPSNRIGSNGNRDLLFVPLHDLADILVDDKNFDDGQNWNQEDTQLDNPSSGAPKWNKRVHLTVRNKHERDNQRNDNNAEGRHDNIRWS